MNENSTDPRARTIESATHGAIWSGDHVVWTWIRVIEGVTVTIRREGIAHHRDEEGDWRTAEGGRITDSDGENTTITIRRPVHPKRIDVGTWHVRRTTPDLPTEDGAVIIPADGHEYIQTRTGKKSRRLTWDADAFVWYDAHGTHLDTDITPGTWQVDDQ